MRGTLVAMMMSTAVGLAAGAFAAAPAVSPVQESTTGGITGTAIFSGTVPAGEPVQMSADPYCSSAHSTPVMLRPIRADSEGRLADVIVWVRDAPAGPVPETPALMTQEGCLYHPHVLAVRSGQTVVFRNDDMTLHNINVQPARNPAFNVGQPIRGMKIERRFANPEVGIPVRCDVHPWMTAYLAVFAHGHFAVTGEEGAFRVEGLPAGDWVLEIWHPTLGSQTREVTVGQGETTVTVELGG